MNSTRDMRHCKSSLSSDIHRHCCAISMMLSIVGGAFFTCLASEYKVSGHLTESHIPRTTGTTSVLSTDYTLWVRNNHWMYHIDYKNGTEIYDAYDGTNRYHIVFDNKSKKSAGAVSESKTGFPERRTPLEKVLWFSLASAAYIEQSENFLEESPFTFDKFAAPIFDVQLERTKTVPHLPLEARFFVSGGRLKSAVEAQRKNSRPDRPFTPLDKLYEPGSEVGVYKTLTTRNIRGMTIPGQFELQVTCGIGSSRWICTQFSGVVTNVTDQGLGAFIPPRLDDDTSIWDSRFQSYVVHYKATNRAWLSKAEASQSGSHVLKPGHFESPPFFGWVALTFFALVTVLPAAVFLWSRWRRKESTNTTITTKTNTV